MELTEFMRIFAPQLEKKIDETMRPLYRMQVMEEDFGSQVEPYPIQREIVRALSEGYRKGRKSLFLVGEMGCGKCAHPETFVTVNNQLMTLEEIYEHFADSSSEIFDGDGYWYTLASEALTPSLDEKSGQIDLKPIKHIFRQRIEEPIKTVRLSCGSTVQVTLAHKFLTPYGWTNIIQKGDYVAIPLTEPYRPKGRSPISPELVGWAIAEGYFHLCRNKLRSGWLTITKYTAEQLFSLIDKVLDGTMMTTLTTLRRKGGLGTGNYTKLIQCLTKTDSQTLTRLRTDLSYRMNAGFTFVPVEEVSVSRYDGWVYDLEIEDTHNFIGNHIVLHNTLQAIWTAENIKAGRTLVVCPPHLVNQWKEEILRAYKTKKVAAIPDPKLRKLDISNMATLQSIHQAAEVDFVVISREAIKTDLPTRDSTFYGKTRKAVICPGCMQELDYNTLIRRKKARTFCGKCGSALFTYCYDHHRARPSLAKYIQKKMKGFFDFTVFDEAHELKAEGTAQGAVLGKLGTKGRVLAMTGTLMGGKASDIFYLLQRTNPSQMNHEGFEHNSVTPFVERYGILEKTYKQDEEDNKYSIGRTRNKETTRERPGLSPLIVGNFLIDKTAFVRLSDFAEKLPIYNEHPVGCRIHHEALPGYDILMGYKDLLRDAKKPQKIISSAIQAMLAYPDTHMEEIICDESEDGEDVPVLVAPALEIPPGETEKEEKLLEIVREAKQKRDKVLIFTTQTKKRDIQPRIMKFLDEKGLRTAVMYNSVSTSKRTEWIKSKTPKIDALICHPRLVATGMNLLEYPVIVFFDTGYSTYVLRQASRRSYRINQPREQIDVYYFYTENTIQQDCLSLMACKNEVSLMAEGEIQEGGLSMMSNGVGSVLNQLAKVINGELKTENPLEVFSRINKLNNEGKRKILKEAEPFEEKEVLEVPPKPYVLPLQARAVQMTLF